MKLHIGGEIRKDGWSILNIQPKDGVDFLGSISDLSQFPDESIEEVYASHVLEHVLLKDIVATLKGIHRILKPKGKLYISVPDMDILCRIIIDPQSSKEIKFLTMRMLFGGQIDDFDVHYIGWNQEFMFDHLQMVGFSEGQRVESLGLFDDASEHKPFGFPISLNVIAIK